MEKSEKSRCKLSALKLELEALRAVHRLSKFENETANKLYLMHQEMALATRSIYKLKGKLDKETLLEEVDKANQIRFNTLKNSLKLVKNRTSERKLLEAPFSSKCDMRKDLELLLKKEQNEIQENKNRFKNFIGAQQKEIEVVKNDIRRSQATLMMSASQQSFKSFKISKSTTSLRTPRPKRKTVGESTDNHKNKDFRVVKGSLFKY